MFNIIDEHPGKHQDGLGVRLVTCIHDRHGTFLTCVRAEGEPFMGMFGKDISPLQVVKVRDGETHFTTANLGTISSEMRKELLTKGTVRGDSFLLLMEEEG
jgi:hypothetical protein